MLPAIMPGDTLTIESISSDAVSEGDIVLFGRGQRLFAHRVISPIRPSCAGIVTRGDAMPTADSPMSDDDLLGRVSLIVRNGKCIAPSRKPGFIDRALAAVLRRSIFAARVVVAVHGMRKAPNTIN
jgi:hypothetical protein